MSYPEHSRQSVLFSFRFLGTCGRWLNPNGSCRRIRCGAGPTRHSRSLYQHFGWTFPDLSRPGRTTEKDRAKVIESLSVPLSLAADPELFEQYQEISRALTALSQRTDPILRRIAMLKFASVSEQIGGWRWAALFFR